MKDFLIKYKDIGVYEDDLIIVKANSTKEAINKFHDYMLNSIVMLNSFKSEILDMLQDEYIKLVCYCGGGEDLDGEKFIEDFLRSKKGFDNKRKFKDLDLDKFVNECFDILSEVFIEYGDYNSAKKFSNEAKEAIYKWKYESIEALRMDKFKVLE